MTANAGRVFTIPATVISAANLANGTTGDEVEVYVRASFKMTNGDVDPGCYLSQSRGGATIMRYDAVQGLSYAEDTMHDVTINHVKNDGTTVEVTNGTAMITSSYPEVVIRNGTDNNAFSHISSVKKFFDGHRLMLKISPKSGYSRNVVVTLGGQDVTSASFDDSTSLLDIIVTDDVVVTITTTANS
jgi:hypothetical protein